jgi:hypothetical protein
LKKEKKIDLMFISKPADSGDVVAVDSFSTDDIFSLRNVDVDSSSITGISSVISLGVDDKLIIDGELNIFGGESNRFVVSDDFDM